MDMMNFPIQAAPVLRSSIPVHHSNSVIQQNCDPLVCAGVAISCISACVSGVGAPACIACLGPAYATCKGCFGG